MEGFVSARPTARRAWTLGRSLLSFRSVPPPPRPSLFASLSYSQRESARKGQRSCCLSACVAYHRWCVYVCQRAVNVQWLVLEPAMANFSMRQRLPLEYLPEPTPAVDPNRTNVSFRSCVAGVTQRQRGARI